jgi:hypothetical protein
MKVSRLVTVLLFVAMLWVAAAAQNPDPASLPVGSAVLADFGGDLTLHAPTGSVLDPVRGMVLEAETAIDTGKNNALLNLQDGSQVLVKAHSHVVLKDPRQDQGFSLQLAIGKLVAKVKKRLGNSPSFRMGTPTAVITVRGTRFEVEVDKKQRTRVEVFEGLVEVRSVGAALGAVMLRPGYLTRVAVNREPEKPRESMDRERGANIGPGGALSDERAEQPGRPEGQERGGREAGEKDDDH